MNAPDARTRRFIASAPPGVRHLSNVPGPHGCYQPDTCVSRPRSAAIVPVRRTGPPSIGRMGRHRVQRSGGDVSLRYVPIASRATMNPSRVPGRPPAKSARNVTTAYCRKPLVDGLVGFAGQERSLFRNRYPDAFARRSALCMNRSNTVTSGRSVRGCARSARGIDTGTASFTTSVISHQYCFQPQFSRLVGEP